MLVLQLHSFWLITHAGLRSMSWLLLGWSAAGAACFAARLAASSNDPKSQISSSRWWWMLCQPLAMLLPPRDVPWGTSEATSCI